MKIKKNAILSFVFLAAIFGYPLVAGLSATFGLPNSTISLMLRVVIAGLSLFLILDNVASSRRGIGRALLLCIAVFMAFYVMRLVVSTLLTSGLAADAASNYWIWTIGSALLPVLGISMARNYDMDWSRLQSRAFIWVFFAAVFVSMNLTTSVTTEVETYESGRARLDTLNPISLGHLGASLLLLSLATFWQAGGRRTRSGLLALAGILLGVGLVVASNSRGPIVAAAAAIIFAWMVFTGKNKVVVTLVMVVAAVSFAPLLLWFENTFGVTTYSRLFGQSFANEINVVARLDLYWLAFRAFLEFPLFGAGLEVSEIGAYPHNVTIEAFLAVGLFGGFVFVILQLLSVTIAWRLCRDRKELIWVGMIIIQYMVAAQFSGSLYASPQFWAVIGFAAFVSSALRSAERGRAQAPAASALQPDGAIVHDQAG